MEDITKEEIIAKMEEAAVVEDNISMALTYKIQDNPFGNFMKKAKDKIEYHFGRYMRLRFVANWLRTGDFPDDHDMVSYEAYKSEYMSSEEYGKISKTDLLSLYENRMFEEWIKAINKRSYSLSMD